ncbi:hypothetical protein HWB52_gp32 [Pseudomonas phage Littlefix]|uniref:Uncharacterized protein n=1 Tax=Pseudomonas phage Littlefix TaxID=2079289 RepID=A0A2K9VHR3_9CAUD|nr:hypothetical protein HWB52_gp32 [Pseudomonas phage Littlefix]AUV61847.1 hypothetical protein PsPhLittlefix_gp32 [Pseudomonas phage Littlefix]
MRTIIAILAGIAIFMYADLALSYELIGYGLTPYIAVPAIIAILAMTTFAFCAEHKRFMFNLSN